MHSRPKSVLVTWQWPLQSAKKRRSRAGKWGRVCCFRFLNELMYPYINIYIYIYIYINTQQKKQKQKKQKNKKTKKSSPIFDHFLERHECVCGCFCLLFYFLFSLYNFLQMRLCANARQVNSKGWINTSQNEIYIEGFQTKGKGRMCHQICFVTLYYRKCYFLKSQCKSVKLIMGSPCI